MRRLVLIVTIQMILIHTINAQEITHEKVPLSAEYTSFQIEDDNIKKILLKTSQNMVDKFNHNASFFDTQLEKGDDQKISNFSSLFAEEATIYNYINIVNPRNIPMSDFINFIYTDFKDQKFDFEIISADLIKLNDESNFYTGEMKIELKQYSGLDNNGKSKFNSKGWIRDLTIVYRIYPYDTEIAEILSISGVERNKISIDKVANFDINLLAGKGFIYANLETNYKDALGNVSTSATSYGFDAIYRKSFNQKQSLFITVGGSAQLINLKTKMENFYSFDNNEKGITLINNMPLRVDGSKVSGNLGVINSANSDNANNHATGYVYSISDGLESNKGIRIGIPLGISYRASKGLLTRFFIDAVAIPTFIIWNNSSIDGEVNIAKVPNSNFPDRKLLQNIIYLTNDNKKVIDISENQFKEIYSIGGIESKKLTPESTFDIDLKVSPSYKKLIGPDWGISLGLDLQMNLLNIFKNQKYTSNFLEGDLNNFEKRTYSLHEDLIKSNKLFNTSIRIGFYKDL